MITDIEDYFTKGCGRCDRFATPACSTRQWIDGLNRLRRICRKAGLIETLKYGHPCFMHGGRNIAIIGAFRNDFRLSFFDAALLTDAEGILEKQGPNTRHANMIRFNDNAQVANRVDLILSYLREAMGHAELGLRPPREAGTLELPDELIEALDADPELADAFHVLTPGRQRSYAIALSSAKASTTRIARIAKFRSKIIAGKGAMER